jgi:hypothetical protein
MTRWKYVMMRWTLVQLRRIARRYSINFDNAAESSKKALPPLDPQSR